MHQRNGRGRQAANRAIQSEGRSVSEHDPPTYPLGGDFTSGLEI